MKHGFSVPAFKVLLAVSLLGCLWGCPFEFGEPSSLYGTCESEADCASFQACSKITGNCVLSAPNPEMNRVAGPIQCPQDMVRFSGAALRAQWPDIRRDGQFFTARQISLDHGCGVQVPNNDGLGFLHADSGRAYDPAVGRVIFFRMFVIFQIGQLRPGLNPFSVEGGAIYRCDGQPEGPGGQDNTLFNDPDGPRTSEECTRVVFVTSGTLDLDADHLIATNQLAGRLNLRLVP